MEIRPDYYDKFRCIAADCKHNCCIGWEIDIDHDTYKKYKAVTGQLGQKLKANISTDPDAHFILGAGERCPFLNEQNLCELILYGGEDMLCQICSDHPRFYNDLYGVREKGLGLSCEAVAKLVLTSPNPTRLISDGEIPKDEFYIKRGEIFAILQNRALPLKDRITAILDFAETSLAVEGFDWLGVYKNLERLDANWDNYLNSADAICSDIPEFLEIPCEQLIWYFIYRHLSASVDDFLFDERLKFAILSSYVIVSVSKTKTLDEILEVARMYSAEVEYSDQNVDTLLDILTSN